MNKALHALVYLFLILAGAALWFELQLNSKRSLLTDRNRIQEDYFVKIARTIERDAPEKAAPPELKLDVSPVEAKIVDVREEENVLEDYNNTLETQNVATYDWSNARDQLRAVYALDGEGKPVMDGNRPLMSGPGTEADLLEKLFESSKNQLSRLNTTRAELGKLRGKLEETVEELNKLKPLARQDKVTIEEKKEQIAKLEGDKATLEDNITKLKAQIEELNADITNLKDQVTTAKDEAAAKDEELEKKDKLVEQLKKALAEALQLRNTANQGGGGTAVTSLPAGDKGVIVDADNENMYAIVKFSEEAIKELKGGNENAMLPSLELGIRRKGFNGQAGEFVGRVKIRQEIKGKPYVICDILGSWSQDKLAKDDIVFAD